MRPCGHGEDLKLRLVDMEFVILLVARERLVDDVPDLRRPGVRAKKRRAGVAEWPRGLNSLCTTASHSAGVRT